MRILEQIHSLAITYGGWKVVVYAVVHSYELCDGIWFHHLHSWSAAANPVSRWARLRTMAGLGLSNLRQKELVHDWFMQEQMMFENEVRMKLNN